MDALRKPAGILLTSVVILLAVAIGYAEQAHNTLLKTGDTHWQDYFLVRALQGGDVQQPQCNPDPDIEAQLEKMLNEGPPGGADPLAALLGPPDASETRQMLERSRDLCREKWRHFNAINQSLSPGLQLFISAERSVLWLAQFTTRKLPDLVVILLLLAAGRSTLRPHPTSMAPSSSNIALRLITLCNLVATALLAGTLLYQGLSSSQPPTTIDLRIYGALFSVLVITNVIRLRATRADTQSAEDKGLALLAIPALSLLTLLAAGALALVGLQAGIDALRYTHQSVQFANIVVGFMTATWIARLLIGRNQAG